MISILVHLANAEPVKLDVEELPSPTDNFIIGDNPRERSDKELAWIDEGVKTVIFPAWRVNFIQVLPSGDEQVEFPMPFRED